MSLYQALRSGLGICAWGWLFVGDHLAEAGDVALEPDNFAGP